MSDLIEALTELRASRHAYDEAKGYYEGDAHERFTSPFIEKLLGGTDEHSFKINLACRPVDAVKDRLEIAAITCADDTDTKILTKQVWDANRMDLEAPQIHKKTLMYGDAYLFVWESEPEDDTDDEDEAPAGDAEPIVQPVIGVDMFYNSPLSVRILYDPEHPRRKRLAIKSWCITDDEGNELTRVNLYYRDRFEKYVSKAGSKAAEDGDFEAYVDQHTDVDGVMVNPYKRIPFFHYRNEGQYGTPAHKNAYGPQDAITKLVTNQMTNSDFTAAPQRVGLMDPNATTDDDTDWGYDETVDPENKPSSMISRPGSMWILRNYKDVKEFSAADVDNFLKPMGVYVRFMAATTGTPLRWFDPAGGVPSGESIRADEAPLNKKASLWMMSLRDTHSEALSFAMEILGRPGAVVTVRWKSPLTVDDLQFWQTVIARQQAGIPVRQTLIEAGYLEALVTAWGYTEKQPDGPFLTPEELLLPTRQKQAGR